MNKVKTVSARVGSESQIFWADVPIGDDCWEWPKCRNAKGYGQFWTGSKFVGAHRFAFQDQVRVLLAGEVIDHLCRNPSCVRPSHLEATDIKTNTLRGNAPTAINARKTACPKGHAYDEVNTRLSRDGDRHCRACERLRPIRGPRARTYGVAPLATAAD